jgi:hypothetical protein
MDQSVMTFASSGARGSAIASPTEGMVTYLEDSNSLQLWDGARWTSAGGVSSGNAIINGAFDIWQRGTSFSQANSYTADRWQQSTDKTATISRQTFTPGAAPVAGYEGSFFLRHAASAGGSFQVVQQRIEDVRTFAGETVTLSYWAKADAAVNNVVIMEQDFGSGGSSAVSTSSVTHALTTSWARYTATISVPSISGKTIGTNSSLVVRVIRTIDALAHTVDIWGVQLEAGSVANPFRRNANSIQGELAACQRYYVEFGTANDGFKNFALVAAESSTTAYGYLYPPVRLRSAPAASASGTFVYNDIGTNRSITLTVIAQTAQTDVVMLVATGTGFTGGRAGRIFSFADFAAKIILNSEL